MNFQNQSFNPFFLTILLSVLTLSTNAQNDANLSYLALGDSYTICESISPEQRWPLKLQRKLVAAGLSVKSPKIIAKTGWRTDNMLEASKTEIGSSKFDLVSLLIGVNNEFQGQSPEEFEPQFRESLEYAIAHCNHGTSGVFVLSIPDYGYTPYGKPAQPEISKRIDAYNEICERISNEMEVPFYNITDISRLGLKDHSLVAIDGLHPSSIQYQLWVDGFADDLMKIIDKF